MAKWPKYKLHEKESIVTQISQRGLYVMRDEKKISKYNCNWNEREQLNDLLKIKTEYGDAVLHQNIF